MSRSSKKNTGGKTPVPTRDVNAAQRAQLAIQLRAERLGWDEIARRAGYASRGAAHNAVMRELERTTSEKSNELRREELDMLNRLHAAIWHLAVPDPEEITITDKDSDDEKEVKRKKRGSQLFAVDRLIALSERRSKLMGLDQPVDSAIAANMVVVRAMPPDYLGTPVPSAQPRIQEPQ